MARRKLPTFAATEHHGYFASLSDALAVRGWCDGLAEDRPWQTVWDILRGWNPPNAFAIHGIGETMPTQVETVLAFRNQHSAPYETAW